MHRFFDGLKAPLHVSHRGGAGLYPENTMGAFKAALEVHRTDVLELDLRLTRDGELVVMHDATVDRCTDGRGEVRDLTFAQLSQLDAGFHFTQDGVTHPFRGQGAKVPRFTEVLRAFPTARINVELKSADTLEPFVRLVQAEGAVERLCMGSELDEIAAPLTERLPEACCFYPRDALAAFVLPLMAGEAPEDDGRYTVLDMPDEWEGMRLFTPALREATRRMGKWVNVWTVNDEARMRELIALGVGGVMTDLPDVLRRVIDEARAR